MRHHPFSGCVRRPLYPSAGPTDLGPSVSFGSLVPNAPTLGANNLQFAFNTRNPVGTINFQQNTWRRSPASPSTTLTNLPLGVAPGTPNGGRFGFGAANSVRGARVMQISASSTQKYLKF